MCVCVLLLPGAVNFPSSPSRLYTFVLRLYYTHDKHIYYILLHFVVFPNRIENNDKIYFINILYCTVFAKRNDSAYVEPS